MRFIELMVQGIPGTKGPLRFPFEPGLNAWKQKGSVRLETLVELIFSLLYPTPSQTGELGPGKSQQAGMTFEARGTTYRIVRDYLKGGVQLSQLEPASQTNFRELSKELRFIREAFSRSAQLPAQNTFRILFTTKLTDSLTGDTLPVPSASFMKEIETDTSAKRLAALKEELEHHQFITDFSAKVDHLQSLLFKVEEQIRSLQGPRERLTQVLQDYEPYKIFDNADLLTPQLLARLKNYKKNVDRREADLAALQEKSEELDNARMGLPERPWWQEPACLWGAGAAVVLFIAAGFTRHMKWAFASSWVLIFAALGFTVWGIFNGLRRVEKVVALKKQINGLDQEKAGIEKRFEIETNGIKEFFEKVNNNDPDEIQSMLIQRENLAAEKKSAEENWRLMQDAIPEDKLKKDREQIQKEIRSIENRLADLPPVTGDVNYIRREIAKIETESPPTSESKLHASPRAMPADDVNQAVALASEMLRRPAPDLLLMIQNGIQANLTAMTSKRYTGVEVRQGCIEGFLGADGTRVHWSEIEGQTKAQFLFAVQFTLWQALANSGYQIPIVIDQISENKFESLRPLSLSAAQHLAKKTQVLVLAGESS